MTDPTPTTNEEIALKLGWTKLPNTMWRDQNGAIWMGIPDFEHDWAHAGPLWGELVSGVGMRDASHRVSFALPIAAGMYPSSGELIAATSHAWLAWKKEEKE